MHASSATLRGRFSFAVGTTREASNEKSSECPLFCVGELLAVLPIALITGLTVAFTYWIMSAVFPGHATEVATMTVLTATFFGVYLVFLVGIMLDVTIDKAAKRARLLYLLSVVVVAAGSFGFGFLRDFFDFTVPKLFIMWPAIGVIILATLTQLFIARRVGRRLTLNS